MHWWTLLKYPPSVHASVHVCVRQSQLVSDHYLRNHTSHCFHTGTVNSPKQPSDLISIPSCSSNLTPNAGLWLVDTFPTIISATTHIASILHLWTYPVNLPPDLFSLLSCSSDFPPNAGLWLVDRVPTIISTTGHSIASILKLWTHLCNHQTWLLCHHVPAIFCQILNSDLLIGFQQLSLQPLIILLP